MKKALSFYCTIFAVLATSLSAGPASAFRPSAAGVAPPTDEVIIDVVTTNGSGCPPDTAAITMVLGNSAFAITYSDYTARLGVGAAVTDFRKNCQLNVIVRVPQGFTYALSKTNHRGFASLAAGARATHRANQYYKGQTSTAYTSHPFSGPMDYDWQTSDEVPSGSMVWTPCGTARNLNINTELRVAAGTSDTRTTTSFITTDSAVYHLSWARCS